MRSVSTGVIVAKARSVLCYWGTRELGMSAIGISKKMNIASSTVSEAVARGRKIVEQQGLRLLDKDIE
jgi:putative transposase